MRKTSAAVLVVLGFLGFAVQSQAADTGTITVTVSLAEDVSVAISPAADWAIGPIAMGGSSPSPTYAATNDGNVEIDLTIKATNGAGGWSLAASAGVDAFSVALSTPEINLSTSGQSLAICVAPAAAEAINMTYSAPSSETIGAGVDQRFTITVTAAKYVP